MFLLYCIVVLFLCEFCWFFSLLVVARQPGSRAQQAICQLAVKEKTISVHFDAADMSCELRGCEFEIDRRTTHSIKRKINEQDFLISNRARNNE
jgi:hypothetical protein